MTTKYSDNLSKKTNFRDLKNIVSLYADDLLENNECIISIEEGKEINNIRDIIIVYTDLNGNNIKRVIKIQKTINKVRIPRGVLERQNLNPFGKALDGNNSTTLDKSISIDKFNKNNEELIKNIIKNKKINDSQKSKYKPPKKSNIILDNKKTSKKYTPPTLNNKNNIKLKKKLFKLKINNLSYDTTENDIIQLCSKFGNIINCFIPKHNYGKYKGKSKCFALVKFDLEESCDNCFVNLNNYKYEGMILDVEKKN